MRRSRLVSAEACIPDEPGRCSICADEGLVGDVVEVLADEPSARVRIGGTLQEVALDLLDGVRAGDSVVVHLGFAIARVQDE